MSEANYAELLRSLSRDYCQGHIDFGDYRERRNSILDDIDFDYNGIQPSAEVVDSNEQTPSIEGDEGSLFGKVFGLFKHDNESD